MIDTSNGTARVRPAELVGRAVPEGVVFAPFPGSQGPVRLGVLVHNASRDKRAMLIPVRETPYARVVLGAMLDAAGTVVKVIEIWTPHTAGGGEGSSGGFLGNEAVDRLWLDWAEGKLITGSCIVCGRERQRGPMIVVDLSAATCREIGVASSGGSSPQGWSLCTSDQALRDAGLPEYSTTMNRYAWNGGPGVGAEFASFDPGAPEHPRCKPLTAALSLSPNEEVLCDGSFMLCHVCPDLGFEEASDAISYADEEGASTTGKAQAETLARALGQLLLSERGSIASGLIERLHLKLRLLDDALAGIEEWTKRSGTPLLNLRPESFGVRVALGSDGLPSLWNMNARLVEPGAALPMSVRGHELRYFVIPPTLPRSVYMPASAVQMSGGQGVLRLKKAESTKAGLVMEGALSTQEPLSLGRRDLVRLVFSTGRGRVDLFAGRAPDAGQVRGELRLVTLAEKLAPEVADDLARMGGSVIRNVYFETVPVLSSACDLESVGILAARVLLVNGGYDLADCVFELRGLAGELSGGTEGGQASKTLPERVREILKTEPHRERWLASLGPHRLVRSGVTPEEGIAAVSTRLWSHVLAMIVRTLVGAGPDSTCPDFGAAPADSPYEVFADVRKDLYDLLAWTRSLIFRDAEADVEVLSMLAKWVDK